MMYRSDEVLKVMRKREIGANGAGIYIASELSKFPDGILRLTMGSAVWETTVTMVAKSVERSCDGASAELRRRYRTS